MLIASSHGMVATCCARAAILHRTIERRGHSVTAEADRPEAAVLIRHLRRLPLVPALSHRVSQLNMAQLSGGAHPTGSRRDWNRECPPERQAGSKAFSALQDDLGDGTRMPPEDETAQMGHCRLRPSAESRATPPPPRDVCLAAAKAAGYCAAATVIRFGLIRCGCRNLSCGKWLGATHRDVVLLLWTATALCLRLPVAARLLLEQASLRPDQSTPGSYLIGFRSVAESCIGRRRT